MQTPHNTEKVLNKIKRFSVVVFLKRFMYVIIGIAVIVLSVVLGLWDVRSVEFQEGDIKYSNMESIKNSSDTLKGMDIFMIDPQFVESEIKKENPFIKSIEVDKVIPSKLVLKIHEYIPRFIYYSVVNCNVYSEMGIRIESICENCLEECNSQKDSFSSIYVSSENSLESDGVFLYSNELNSFIRLLSEFGYDISEVNIKDGVTTLVSQDKTFVFDLNQGLDIQMARMYLVGEKINQDSISFVSLDLRFERPILKTE